MTLLLQIYAKCIAGQEELARRSIQEALRTPIDAVSADSPPAAAVNREEPGPTEEG